MIARLTTLTCFLAPVMATLLSAASAEVAGGAKWTLIGTDREKAPDGTISNVTLYVELPVLRSGDKSLAVVHSRTSSDPPMKGLRPGDEMKTIEAVAVFDCQKREYWNVYTIGLPWPALRNTVPGSGERRQIQVLDFDSDAVRATDWPGVTVAAFVCKQ